MPTLVNPTETPLIGRWAEGQLLREVRFLPDGVATEVSDTTFKALLANENFKRDILPQLKKVDGGGHVKVDPKEFDQDKGGKPKV